MNAEIVGRSGFSQVVGIGGSGIPGLQVTGKRSLLTEDIGWNDTSSGEAQVLIDACGETAITEQEAEVVGVGLVRIAIATIRRTWMKHFSFHTWLWATFCGKIPLSRGCMASS